VEFSEDIWRLVERTFRERETNFDMDQGSNNGFKGFSNTREAEGK